MIIRMAEEYLDVALFPIPGMVCFPYCSVPLHVFEPRYRAMIEDSIKHERLIGVCNTIKQISAAKKTDSLEDALRTNQSTYEPCKIYGVGRCKLVEKTSDGRIYVTIYCTNRVESVREIQTLPYTIMQCREIPDSPVVNIENLNIMKTNILKLLKELISKQYSKDKLNLKKWSEMQPHIFSFKIFQILKLDPEIMQGLLEITNPEQRLIKVHGFLKKSVQ
ncbi:MAG: hypothetical protein CMK38_05495 [Porticoccaceae bacterium]|nr:hypothetical protein [Porticoccaceae bacterium]